jgi:membrane protein YdbS with pleckstrin-like domain
MKFQTKVPLYLRFIIFNVMMLASLGFTGRLRPDWPSIVAVIVALIVMNFVAWISSRHYKEWK